MEIQINNGWKWTTTNYNGIFGLIHSLEKGLKTSKKLKVKITAERIFEYAITKPADVLEMLKDVEFWIKSDKTFKE